MSAKVIARQQKRSAGLGRPQPSVLPPLPPAMDLQERREMMHRAVSGVDSTPGQPIYSEEQVTQLMDEMEQHFRNQYVTVVDELVYENDDLKDRIRQIEDQRERSGVEVEHLITGKEEARNLANAEGQQVLYDLVDYLMSKYEEEAIEAKSEASKLAGLSSSLQKEVEVLKQEKKDLEEHTLKEFATNMENEAMNKMEYEYKKIRQALADKEKECKALQTEHDAERVTLEKIIESMTKEHKEKYEAIRDENWSLERNSDKARDEYDRELKKVIAARDKMERDFEHRVVEAGEQLAHVKGKLESFQLRFDQLSVEKKILHDELERQQLANRNVVTQDEVDELKRQIAVWKDKYNQERDTREKEREESYFRERHLRDIALEERATLNETQTAADEKLRQLQMQMQEQQSQAAESQQSESHTRLQREKEMMLFHFEDVRSFHVERALDRAEIVRWQKHVSKLEKQFEKSIRDAQRKVRLASGQTGGHPPFKSSGLSQTDNSDDDLDITAESEPRSGRKGRKKPAAVAGSLAREREVEKEEVARQRAQDRAVIAQLTAIVQNLEAEKDDQAAKMKAQNAEVEALRKHTSELAKHSRLTSAQLTVAQQQRTDALRKLDTFHAERLDVSAGISSPTPPPAQRPSPAAAAPPSAEGGGENTKTDGRFQPVISEIQAAHRRGTAQSSASPPGPPVPPRGPAQQESMQTRLKRRLTETAPPGVQRQILEQQQREEQEQVE